MPSTSGPSRTALLMATAALAVAGLSACTDDPEDDPAAADAVPEISVDWVPVTLPDAPVGRRIAVRDGTWCGDRWLVVGGLLGPGDASRPAAWTSTDATTWQEVRFRTSTYWGGRAVLSTVACRGTEPVAVGAMSGGAHGNPRVVTFHTAARAVWVDVPAPFEQYGGPSAVNVGPVTAGDAGWLITGNRRTGPAAWIARSPDRFQLIEKAPGLVGDGPDAPFARGAAWDGSGWTIVGGTTGEDALDRVPVAWRSSANRGDWVREPVPDTGGYDDLYRAVRLGDSLVALGLRDSGYGSWVRDGTGWHDAGSFGTTDGQGGGAAAVTSATSGADGVLTTTTDGTDRQLWWSADATTWWQVDVPETPTGTGDSALAVASSGTTILLVADAGDGGRGWIAGWTDLDEPQ